MYRFNKPIHKTMMSFLKRGVLYFLAIGMFSCGSAKSNNNSSINKNVSTTNSKAYYVQSSGLTIEDAVVIYASGSMQGIPLEYKFIEEQEGRRGLDWSLVIQSLMHEKSKSYDVLTIKLVKTNEEKTYYFDITNFFGKF